MAYSTRSRGTSKTLNAETAVTAKPKSAKKKVNEARSSSKKNVEQNKNAVPPKQVDKRYDKIKSQLKTSLSGSKLHYAKEYNNSSKNTVLALKSPILKDRTNIANGTASVKLSSKKTNEVKSDENKKEMKKKNIKKLKQKTDENLSGKLQTPLEKHTAEARVAQNKMYSEKEIENMLNEDEEIKISSKKVIKRSAKKSKDKIVENVSNVLQSSLEKYTAEAPGVENKFCSDKEIEEMLNDNQEIEINPKKATNLKKTTTNLTLKTKKIKDVKVSELLASPEAKSNKNNKLKQKNISMEEVEDLLNEDEEINIDKSKVEKVKEKYSNNKKDNKSNIDESNDLQVQTPITNTNLNAESSDKEKMIENQKAKKFFKYKNVEEKVVATTTVKRPGRQISRKRAKIVKEDTDDTLAFKVQKEHVEPITKTLRTRNAKNYCELSRLSQGSKSAIAEKLEDKKTSGIEKSEGKEKVNTEGEKENINVPIYKTIRLSQEKVNDVEEIYDFPDDSQESDKKGKKKKKTTRKPAVKRLKKATNSKPNLPRKKLKKTAEKVLDIVQSKVKNVKLVQKENCEMTNIQSSNAIPEDHQNYEDTLENAENHLRPKVIADQKLEGSKKINLMVTPSVPKTIASELKLFGPKNAITLKPTSQYNNMANHSLIRKSMSPITKVIDNFDAGSPWRPVEAFSRIKKIVQSTPQINRPPIIRGKKVPLLMHFSENSIESANTIHVSSTDNIKFNKEEKVEAKSNEISPRQFGNVITNTSPTQSNAVENIHNAKTIVQNDKKSPVQGISSQTTCTVINPQLSPIKAVSPQKAFSESPINQEIEISSANKENIEPNLTQQTKSKPYTPHPFRFEKMRTSARLAAIESQSKSSNSINLQKENEEHKSVKLKQSNLNKFLKLDEMPESTHISTAHGIFDDVDSTPITEKTPKLFEEPNIENAFGFDDCETTDELSATQHASSSKIVTAEDVQKSVKGKLFPNARVKSALPSRISTNTVKKTLLQTVLKKKPEKNATVVDEEIDENKNMEQKKDSGNMGNYYEQEYQKKVLLDAVSFSDTFDVISENGDLEAKIPDEVPLFLDLEPVHFSQPPRRSYNKRKKGVCFNTYKDVSEDENGDDEVARKRQKKSNKKNKPKLSKEEKKRMDEWVKSVNETFEEIDHFDLLVE